MTFHYSHKCNKNKVALVVRNLPANARKAKDAGSLSVWEDALKKEMAIHSIVLARRISGTEEPGGLQSNGLQRVEGATEAN